MPVYNMTYRSFEGQAKRRFRWSVIVAQEFRVLIKMRPLGWLMLLPLFHFFLRIVQVSAYDTLTSNPNNPLAFLARNASVMTVNSAAFFDFVRVQGFFVFFVTLVAGSGMICNDMRNHLLEIYFSKPLTWKDYVLGKVMTLSILGFGLTAIPGVFLVLLHNMLSPSALTFQQSWWWPLSIIGFSMAIVLPSAMCVLAFSALFRSERYAGLATSLVLFCDFILSNVLAEMLTNRKVLLFSLPTAINRIGEVLFEVRRPAYNLPPTPAFVVVVAVCLVGLWYVVRAARSAEMGS